MARTGPLQRTVCEHPPVWCFGVGYCGCPLFDNSPSGSSSGKQQTQRQQQKRDRRRQKAAHPRQRRQQEPTLGKRQLLARDEKDKRHELRRWETKNSVENLHLEHEEREQLRHEQTAERRRDRTLHELAERQLPQHQAAASRKEKLEELKRQLSEEPSQLLHQ